MLQKTKKNGTPGGSGGSSLFGKTYIPKPKKSNTSDFDADTAKKAVQKQRPSSGCGCGF